MAAGGSERVPGESGQPGRRAAVQQGRRLDGLFGSTLLVMEAFGWERPSCWCVVRWSVWCRWWSEARGGCGFTQQTTWRRQLAPVCSAFVAPHDMPGRFRVEFSGLPFAHCGWHAHIAHCAVEPKRGQEDNLLQLDQLVARVPAARIPAFFQHPRDEC